MQDLGADYSYARPGGAALAGAGVKAAGRYSVPDSRGITAPEHIDLANHGVGSWLCYEGGASGILAGYAAGRADAFTARSVRQAAGYPPTDVMYATADFDIQSSQFPFADAYMGGFASVFGLGCTGIYGGLHYLNHCFVSKLATRFWRAGAASWDHGESPLMPIDLHQTLNPPPVPGTDHNFILDPAFASGGATPLDIPEEPMSYAIVKDANSASEFVVNLNNGLRVGIRSAYHASLLGRLRVNAGSDPMALAEVDICRGYLAAIDMDWSGAPVPPAPVVNVPPLDTAAIIAGVLAGLSVATVEPAEPSTFVITGTISGEAKAS